MGKCVQDSGWGERRVLKFSSEHKAGLYHRLQGQGCPKPMYVLVGTERRILFVAPSSYALSSPP